MGPSVGYGISGWHRDHPPQAGPGLSGDTDAEVVVVGAGLAGLALAHHLARHTDPAGVLVLEAGYVGAGASGRSTGIVGPGVGGPIGGTVRRFGPAIARRMFEASRSGIDRLRELADALPDPTELAAGDQLVAALSAGHAARLRRQAEVLRDTLGAKVEYLDRAATIQRLGTPRWHGGLRYPDVALVNPWLLCRALAADLRRRGVRVAESSPVTTITGGDPVTLTAGWRQVRARRVALTVDGFVPTLGLYRRSVATIRSHVARTDPLPAGLLASTGWDGTGAVLDSRSFFNYFRLTARGHLLFGGGPALLDDRAGRVGVAAVRDRLRRELAAVFPALADVPLTDFWSGVTASTFDRLPIVGPVPGYPGVVSAGAWCGHGLALSAHTAAELAPRLLAAGAWPAPPDGLPWWRERAAPMPSGRLGGLLLAGYLRGLDGTDRLAAAQRIRARGQRQRPDQPGA